MFLFGFWLLGGRQRARYLRFPLIPGTWRASKSALSAVSSDSGYLEGSKERAICGSPGFRVLGGRQRARYLRFPLIPGTWRAPRSALSVVSSDSGYLKGVKERAFRVFFRFRLLGGGLTHTPLDLEDNITQAHYRHPFFLVTLI